MLLTETKVLLNEVIAHQRPEHQRELDNAVRDLKYDLVRRGLLQSSSAEKRKVQVYCESFERFSERIWVESKLLLEQTSFAPFPGAEDEITAIISDAFDNAYRCDLQGLQRITDKTTYSGIIVAQFADRYRRAKAKVATEVKIFCAAASALKAKTQSQAGFTMNNYAQGANARINVGSIDNSTNSVNEADVFAQLRAAIESQVSNSERKAALLALVAEGESAPKKSDIYNNWFSKFIGLSADVIGVVQPFIPALAEMVVKATQ